MKNIFFNYGLEYKEYLQDEMILVCEFIKNISLMWYKKTNKQIVICGERNMLMKEPTEEFIKECKEIYDKNKNNLEPNKKEGLEIADYLKKSILSKKSRIENSKK